MAGADYMKTLQELIDSDEELPNSYEEIPDIPAYKCDYRFEEITFPWVKKYIDTQFSRNSNISTLYTQVNDKTVYEQMKPLEQGETSLITKAVLSEEDIFCLKTIEINTCDATLLWLMNFLIYKDMQTRYTQRKRCLVDLHPYYVHDSNSWIIINKYLRFNFKIEE
ncbi:uncharacterized protein ACR2FA_009537 isoform 1-T2 [Aphomia sociella]